MEGLAERGVAGAFAFADEGARGFAEGEEELVGAGEFVWQGLPGKRVAVLPREEAPSLLRDPLEAPPDDPVLALLRERGALFLSEIALGTGLPEREALERIFTLVWAGFVRNDSAPAHRLRFRSRSVTRAVRTTTGIRFVLGSRLS